MSNMFLIYVSKTQGSFLVHVCVFYGVTYHVCKTINAGHHQKPFHSYFYVCNICKLLTFSGLIFISGLMTLALHC